jgi:hypothetical protein
MLTIKVNCLKIKWLSIYLPAYLLEPLTGMYKWLDFRDSYEIQGDAGTSP